MSKRIQNTSKRDFIIFDKDGKKVKLIPMGKEWVTDAEAERLLKISSKELEVIEESKSEPKKASNKEGKKDKEKSDLVKQAKELGIDGAEDLSEGELLNSIQELESK